MKKLALFFVLVSLTAASFAQAFVGGQFAYNSTWLMNKQVFDEGAEMDVAASFGNYFGLVGGYYFTDNFGIEINCNFNKIEQKYSGNIKYFVNDDRNTYNASTVLKTTDFPVLMKFGKKSYFEVGPLIMLVNKATYTRTFDDENSLGLPLGLGIYNNRVYAFSNETNKGVNSFFNSAGFGVAFGFGTNFDLVHDVLIFNFGVRFNYIINDMVGINGLGLTKENTSYITDAGRVNFKTNPLYGGLKVGLIYCFD